MPPNIFPDKCDGCKGLADPVCVSVCPGNLYKLHEETGKAVCRDPGECWDCMTCAIFCPQQAIIHKVQYQIAPIPARLVPRLEKRAITWTLTDCKGQVYRMRNVTLTGGEEDEQE